jgi:hypothetical protein
MRTLVLLLVAVGLSSGTLVGLAVPGAAGGETTAKTTKFCKAVKGLDTQTLGDPTSKSGASSTASRLAKIRRVAQGQAKSALRTVIDAYEQVADGRSARKVFAKVKVVEALSQFSLAVSVCSSFNVPGATAPPISLPSSTPPTKK